MNELDHQQLVRDLRLRVLNGDEISAEEMLQIVNDIRVGRRAAAPAERAPKAAKRSKSAAPPEDLTAILDQGL